MSKYPPLKGRCAAALSISFAFLVIIIVLGLSTEMVEGSTKRAEAILVQGDGNFTSGNGVLSGSGSSSDPYIIEGWELTCSTTDSIKVSNTRKHLVIKDIMFNNTRSKGDRIQLYNVTNVTLSNILIMQPGIPLEIRISENVTVRNLTTHYKAWVQVFHSKWIDLLDVDISKGGGRFYLVSSNDTRFINCHTANDTQPGFRMQSGKRVSIIRCTARNHPMGLELGGYTRDYTVKGCTFENSTSYEASIGGKNNTVIQNKFGRIGVSINLMGWQNIDNTNTVDGRPLLFHLNETGKTLFGDIGQIYLVGCSEFVVRDIAFDGVKLPITCYNITDCAFQDLVMMNATRCIAADYAYNCEYTRVSGVPTRIGITLSHTANCTLVALHFRAELLGFSTATTYVIFLNDPDNATIRDTSVVGLFSTGIRIDGIGAGTGSVELHNVTVIGSQETTSYERGIHLSKVRSAIIANSTVRVQEEYNLVAQVVRTIELRDSEFDEARSRDALYIKDCDLVQILRNNITRCNRAIFISSCERGLIHANWIGNCSYIGVFATLSETGTEIIITHNVVSNCGGSAIECLKNTTIAHNTIYNCSSAFQTNWANATLYDNTVSNCSTYGVCASWNDDSIFRDNTFINCRWTMRIYQCERVRIYNNTISHGEWGIDVIGSEECILTYNQISNFSKGVFLRDSMNCTVSHNDIHDQTWHAVTCNGGLGNVVHHNVMVRNTYDPSTGQYKGEQATSDTSTEFDNGHAGNYWGDYQLRYPNAEQAKGVWDTPYVVGQGVVDDAYPLATMVRDASPPTAVVTGGPEVTVDQNSTVDLDGSGSTDDVGILGYFWTFEYGGGPVNLSGSKVQFTFDLPGVYKVTFSVFDAWDNSDTVEITITVKDTQPPVADAGVDIIVGMGERFNLDATASRDNGIIVNYTWTVDPGGLDIVLYGAVTGLTIEAPGHYRVLLNITDGGGNWATDELKVTVEDREFPAADAGRDITVIQGTKAQLDGTASSDNVGVVNWTWTFTYDGAGRTLHGPRPTFVFHALGTYEVTLTVRDGWGNFDYDTVTVRVIMEDTEPPVADAGGDITVDEGTEVDLSGGSSTDNAGITNYTWVVDYQGEGHVLHGEVTSFAFDVPGVYTVTLTVLDVGGNTDVVTITVTVRDATPPVAEFTLPSEVDHGEEVTLDGSASSDNVGIVMFTWTIYEQSGPVEVEGVQVAYAIQTAGEMTVTLTVADAAGLTDSRNRVVNVMDRTAPLGHAGGDMTLVEGETTHLDGTGSTDNVGVETFSWTITFGDQEWTLEGAAPEFTFEQVGEYTVVLDVTDRAGNAGHDALTVKVLPREVDWVLGPFMDADGRPVAGVNVTMKLDGKDHEGTTDGSGLLKLRVDRMDLVGEVTFTTEKEGWEPLEFTLELDEEGEPVGDIPAMTRATGPDDDGDAGDHDGIGPSGLILAMVAVTAAVVALGALVWSRRRGG